MEVLDAFLDNIVVEIIDPIILLLSGGAFVVLLWGIFQFIYHAGDSTKRAEGRSAILWGIVGLVIIFGAFGIINIALRTFSLGSVQQI